MSRGNRLRRMLALCLAAALALSLTGCWSRREINEIAIIVAIGIDYEAGPRPYRVTMQVARVASLVRGGAAQGGSQGPPVEVVTGTGRTVVEAERTLQRSVPRRFHPMHNEVWIIGESMARRGIVPLADFFQREPLNRPNMKVLVAHGRATDVLRYGEDLERTLAETVTGLLRFHSIIVGALPVTVNELGLTLSHPGRQPVIPGVELRRNTVVRGKPMVTIDNLALFKGDRLVGWYNRDASRGFLWVRDRSPKGDLIVTCPGEPGRRATLDITRSHTNRQVRFAQGRPVVIVNVNFESDLVTQECRRNLATPAGFQQLDAAQEAEATRMIQLAVAHTKALRTDVFGFGEEVYRTAPDYWRQVARRWDDQVFPTAPVQIRVSANARRPGIMTDPARRMEAPGEAQGS